MLHKTVQAIFALTFCIAHCVCAPHQQYGKTLADVDEPQLILGEGIVSAQLNLKPNSKINDAATAYKEPTIEAGKNENDPVDFGTNEYIAELTNDQFEHAAPSTEHLSNNNKRANIRVPGSSPVSLASVNPIYITIPIYLNKSDGQPLRLSVAGQEIPLTPKAFANGLNEAPLSPTSQFNRLLKQKSTQQTKQHKKPSRKTSGKKKRHHTSSRKHSSKVSNDESDKQILSYRFYF